MLLVLAVVIGLDCGGSVVVSRTRLGVIAPGLVRFLSCLIYVKWPGKSSLCRLFFGSPINVRVWRALVTPT